jgi:PIN domain nuclease of toxin-antitoxin system
MMRFLLDTDTWLWAALEPRKLSSEVHDLPASLEPQLVLSPISLWELSVLLEKR